MGTITKKYIIIILFEKIIMKKECQYCHHLKHLSNEEKTNDYENFEKGMIYMKILKKGGVVGKRGEEEAKSMPHAPVLPTG
jgi:thioredoxin-related protein